MRGGMEGSHVQAEAEMAYPTECEEDTRSGRGQRGVPYEGTTDRAEEMRMEGAKEATKAALSLLHQGDVVMRNTSR